MKNLLYSLVFLSLMAITACGGGGGSDEAATTKPDAPTKVRAMAGRGHVSGANEDYNYVVLRWNASSGASSYTIYYSTTDSDVTTASSSVTGVTDTYHLFTNAPADFKLWFAVTASNSAGESDLSAVKRMAVQIAATGQTTTYAANDDGALQKGVPWSSDRFIYTYDPVYFDTALDTMTGLIWPGPNYYIYLDSNTWLHAIITDCPGYTIGNTTGWRLPNRRELMSLIDYSSDTSDLPSTESYWTSTTDVASASDTPPSAWAINMGSGISSITETNSRYILPVRDANGYATAEVARTGQDVTQPFPYSAGGNDDGGLQKGVIWPSPRFTNNGDGTITDILTGLMWVRDPGTTTYLWAGAVSTAAAISTGNYHDWRLPNVRELESLLDMSNTNPCLPSSPPFLNYNHSFWTSTTLASSTTSAWYINISDGSIQTAAKSTSYYVWPVRSTQ